MYDIFCLIWLIFMATVGKYTIHGLFGFSMVMLVFGGGGGVCTNCFFLETIFFCSSQDETRPPVNVETELSECGLKKEMKTTSCESCEHRNGST